MKKVKSPKWLYTIFGAIGGFLKVFIELLGYWTFAYILCFLIFGGEFKIEIHFKEGIEALKNILNNL